MAFADAIQTTVNNLKKRYPTRWQTIDKIKKEFVDRHQAGKFEGLDLRDIEDQLIEEANSRCQKQKPYRSGKRSPK